MTPDEKTVAVLNHLMMNDANFAGAYAMGLATAFCLQKGIQPDATVLEAACAAGERHALIGRELVIDVESATEEWLALNQFHTEMRPIQHFKGRKETR